MNVYNMRAKRGDTFDSPVFRILVNGEPLDLTDYEIVATFKKSPTQTIPSIQFPSIGYEVVKVNAVDGQFMLHANKLESSSGSYRWDVQFTSPFGVVKTYFGGEMFISDDITEYA